MQRIRFVLQIKLERLAEYKERHRSVWPEMQAALRETRWGKYSLFLRDDDGLLVGYLETENFERARAGMAGREVNDSWQREMGDFFVSARRGPARPRHAAAGRSVSLVISALANLHQ